METGIAARDAQTEAKLLVPQAQPERLGVFPSRLDRKLGNGMPRKIPRGPSQIRSSMALRARDKSNRDSNQAWDMDLNMKII